jgi:hypothetical protein
MYANRRKRTDKQAKQSKKKLQDENLNGTKAMQEKIWVIRRIFPTDLIGNVPNISIKH